MLDTFHLLRPLWLVALLALPLIDRLLRSGALVSSAWSRIVAPRLLPYLVAERVPGAGADALARLARWLPLVAFAVTVLALAGPAWQQLPQPVLRDQSSLVIAFDLSRSMNATDLAPSRLERARLKVIDLLERRQDGQTGLVSYAGLPFVVSPLTTDAATIQSLVPVLEPRIMPLAGSRADRALALAASLIDGGGDGSGAVLLVTDSAEERDVRMATKLRERGIVTSVLAVGTREGAPVRQADGSLLKDDGGRIVHSRLDEARLQALARAGGGRYTRLTIDDGDLDRLDDALASTGRFEDEDEMSTDIWREEGPWLLLPLIPLAALAFRRGVLAAVLLAVLVPLPRDAHAFDWSSLWQRRDQRGVTALDEARYDEALALLDDEEWQAAAYYRDGQYERSAEVLETRDDVRARYNLGTALARAGRYREAIEVYRELLDRHPDHADAQHNLDVLLEEMERQQQQQQNQQQGDGEQQNGQPQSADGAQGSQGRSGQGQQSQRGQQSQGGGGSPMDEEQFAEQQGQQQEQDERMSQEEIAREAQRRARQALPDGEDGEEDAQRVARLGQQQDADGEAREQQAAVEQWLRRIPDDPGGLLRRKFLYELQRQRQQGEVTEEDPW